MMSLRILLSLAIMYLAVFSTGCGPDRQDPKNQEETTGQAEPTTPEEGVISGQDFETGGTGQWKPAPKDPDVSSEDGDEEKPPAP